MTDEPTVSGPVTEASAYTGIPLPPAWFYGWDWTGWDGAKVQFVDEDDGDESAASEINRGEWAVFPDPREFRRGRIVVTRPVGTEHRTEVYEVKAADVRRVSPRDLSEGA